MLQRIIRFIQDPTSKNVIINTSGNYLNVIFTAFFALILFRSMTPAEYGVFSVLIGLSYVMSNILEFGTTASIYSTVPALFHEEDDRLYTFIKSTFFYQTILSVIVITALIVSFPYLDHMFFKTGAPTWVLTMTAFTILLFVWQNFLTNILFAAKRFFRANLYLNTSNVVKAIILIFLTLTGNVNIATVIMTYGLIGPLIFFLMVLYKNYEQIQPMKVAKFKRDEIKLNYTLTYFAASQFYNVGLRMDLFLLSFFGLRDQVGYYASAQKIILSIIATIVSISQVLSPQFASAKNRIEVLKLFKKGLTYMLIPVGIFIVLLFTPNILFQFIFTKTFDSAILITKILAIPFIMSAIGTIFMLFLLYTVKKPIYILISNVLFFAIVSVGSYVLIPMKGMYGPPIAISVAFCVAILIQIVAVLKEYNMMERG
ncbi:MAG: oligosaccharide flippase family protein [Candidatus Roizmanbacteria bacterium]|nr:oligosaccharide flippase family protein [Candidatus Roizmanbacteria bacterium]